MPKITDFNSLKDQNVHINNSDAILQDILNENYPPFPSQVIFERFLNATLMTLDCNKSKPKKAHFSLNCHERSNAGVQIHLDIFLKENKLSSLIKFFSKNIIQYKNSLSKEAIEKLIFFGNHYTTFSEAKINDTNSEFSINDLQTISSFTNFLSNLLHINNIKNFETHTLIHQKIDNNFPNITLGKLGSIDILISHSIKLMNDLNEKLNYNNFRKEDLLDYFKNLGYLGFQLKVKEEFLTQAEQVYLQAQQLLSSINSENFTSSFKQEAAWTFLNQYHDGNAHDIEESCRSAFKWENCLPSDNESTRLIFDKIQYSDIEPNDFNNANYQFVIDKLLQGTSKNIGNQLNELSRTNRLTNILTFLKDYLKQNNTLDERYIKKTFYLINSLNKITNPHITLLKTTDNKLDIRYFKMVQSQLAFSLNLIKNNSTEKNLFDKIHLIAQLKNLVVDIIELYGATKHSNITDESMMNILKSYLDIINFCKDIDPTLASGYRTFIVAINEINNACLLNANVCNTTQIKKQSFELLGGMARKFDRINRSDLANEVTVSANRLKNSILNYSNISTNELGNDVANFLRIRYSRNQLLMDKNCKEIFGLNPEDCQPFNPNNTITLHPLSIRTTTPTTNTTLAPFTHETSSAPQPTHNFSVVPDSDDFNWPSNETNVNQTTIDDTSMSENQSFLFTSKLGTAMGLGAFTGFLNGGSQIILHIVEQKNCSLRTQRFLALTLALANSLTISTLPLIYSIVENLANEETDSLINSQKLLTCVYAFITSIALQSINVGLQYTLPKNSLLKNIFNLLPLFAGLWIIANGQEDTIESLAILGTNILTSITTSSLTYFGLNRLFPANFRHSNVKANKENKHDECEKIELLTQEKANSSNTTINETQKELNPEEIFFKEVEFTTPEQFKKLKEYLNTTIQLSIKLQHSLSDQDQINRLQEILDVSDRKLGLKYDLEDLENFPKKFITEYKRCQKDTEKLLIIKNNFEYFKTMIKTTYDKLLSDNVNNDCLNFILKLIAEKTTLRSDIEDIVKCIQNNLGFIRGITKPLISIHLTQESIDPVKNKTNAIPRRQGSKRINYSHHRYTFPVNSDTDTRLSSGSDESSKDGEDVQINRSLLKPT